MGKERVKLIKKSCVIIIINSNGGHLQKGEKITIQKGHMGGWVGGNFLIRMVVVKWVFYNYSLNYTFRFCTFCIFHNLKV